MNRSKQQNILVLLGMVIIYGSCSVKDVQRTTHDQAKERTVEEVVFNQNESEDIVIDQVKARSLTVLSNRITESELDSIEKKVESGNVDVLIKFIYDADKVFDTQSIRRYNGYLNYRSLFSLYNRALLNLSAKIDVNHPEAKSLSVIADNYYKRIFEGCDEKYRGCKNYYFFARDYNTAHVLLYRARNTKNVVDRYRLFEFAYGIQNKVVDIEYAYQYSKGAEDYALALTNSGERDRLIVHKKIYEQVLRVMQEHPDDERVITFVSEKLSKSADSGHELFEFERPMVLDMAQKVISLDENKRDDFFKKIFSIPAEEKDVNEVLTKLYRDELAYTSILSQLYRQKIDSEKAYLLWHLAGGDVSRSIGAARGYLDVQYFQTVAKVNELLGTFYSAKKAILGKGNLFQEFNSFSGGLPLSTLNNFFERYAIVLNFIKKIEPEFMIKDAYQDQVKHFSSYGFNASIDVRIPQVILLEYYAIKTQSTMVSYNFAAGKYALSAPETSLRNLFEGVDLENFFVALGANATKGGPNVHDLLHAYRRIIKNDLIKQLYAYNSSYTLKDLTAVIINTLLEPFMRRFSTLDASLKAVVESAEFRKGQSFCASDDPDNFGVVIEQTLEGLSKQVYFSPDSDLYKKNNAFYISFADYQGSEGVSDYVEASQDYKMAEHGTIIGLVNGIVDLYIKETGRSLDSEELQGIKDYKKSKERIVELVKKYNRSVLDCSHRLYAKELRLQFEVLKEFKKTLEDIHSLYVDYSQENDAVAKQEKLRQLNREVKVPVWKALEVEDLPIIDGASADGLEISFLGVAARMKEYLSRLAPELKVVLPTNIKNSNVYLAENQSSTIAFDDDRERFIQNALGIIVSKYLKWIENNRFNILNAGIKLEIYSAMAMAELESVPISDYQDSINLIINMIDRYKDLFEIKADAKSVMAMLRLRSRHNEMNLSEYFVDSSTKKAGHLYDMLFGKLVSFLKYPQAISKFIYNSYYTRPTVFLGGEDVYNEVQPYIYHQLKNKTSFVDEFIEAIRLKEQNDYDSSLSDASMVYQLDSDFNTPLKFIMAPIDHNDKRVKYLDDDLVKSYRNGISEFHKETNYLYTEAGKSL